MLVRGSDHVDIFSIQAKKKRKMVESWHICWFEQLKLSKPSSQCHILANTTGDMTKGNWCPQVLTIQDLGPSDHECPYIHSAELYYSSHMFHQLCASPRISALSPRRSWSSSLSTHTLQPTGLLRRRANIYTSTHSQSSTAIARHAKSIGYVLILIHGPSPNSYGASSVMAPPPSRHGTSESLRSGSREKNTNPGE